MRGVSTNIDMSRTLMMLVLASGCGMDQKGAPFSSKRLPRNRGGGDSLHMFETYLEP